MQLGLGQLDDCEQLAAELGVAGFRREELTDGHELAIGDAVGVDGVDVVGQGGSDDGHVDPATGR